MPQATRFDVDDLRLTGLTALLARLFANPSQRLYGLLRTWLPLLRLPEWRYLAKWLPLPVPRLWVLVTRHDDATEVLARHDLFNVTWVRETKLLNDGNEDGTNFILGIDGGPEYAWQLERVMKAFRREDVARVVAPMSRDAASRIVGQCGGRLDAVADLITDVPLTVCEGYYGVAIPDRRQFAYWTIALSGYLFGPPFDRPRVQATVLAAADLAREALQRAVTAEIELARQDPGRPQATVLARLAHAHVANAKDMPELVLRAFVMGMVVGFVPTNTVAAGHILDVLLTRPQFMAAARQAAQAGDDEQLARTLFETMRYWPLNPGPWRVAARDCTIAEGTPRAKRVRKGRYVVASTQSAMFDPRAIDDPTTFDPGRSAADSLVFGYGLHACAGRFIARTQITQTLKPLLLCRNLRRARGGDGALKLLGLFPEHLVVEFDP